MIEPTNTPKPLGEGGVAAAANCSAGCFACKFCGPKITETKSFYGSIMQIIRCDHPGWENEDTDMREFDAEFGDHCSDFQPNTPALPREASAGAAGSAGIGDFPDGNPGFPPEIPPTP